MNEMPRDDWREMLDPPTGGLMRLIDAVEAAPVSRLRRSAAFALASAGLVAVFGVALGFAWQAHRNSPEYRFQHALEAALRPATPAQGLQVENGAALEIPSADPTVRIYWIAQLPVTASEPRQD